MQSRRRWTLLLYVALSLGALAASACSDKADDGTVHVIEAEGVINPIMAQFIDRALDRAEGDQASLAIIELDTPGGFDSSMRDIVKRIQSAKVPVAVYVSPSGSRAASAGTFITLAGHIAAMAPNTSIGAASAINSDGSDIKGTLGRKVENDAVAFIRGIAELRGRNADWAEDAVRNAVAVTQSRAVELGVVDFVAADVDDLLRQAQGKEVQLAGGERLTIGPLESARRVTTKMTIWERFLGLLSDPTIAGLLISLGILGIYIEMGAPGIGIGGILGVICLSLGFLGFGVLPVDLVGVGLIVLGLVLIGVELFVPSGAFGTGGAIAVVLGAIIAFRDTPADLRPPLWFAVVAAVLFVALIVLIAWLAKAARVGMRDEDGHRFVGKTGVTTTPLAPSGTVLIHGERWQAVIDEGAAAVGQKVRVTGVDGFTLKVRPAKPVP